MDMENRERRVNKPQLVWAIVLTIFAVFYFLGVEEWDFVDIAIGFGIVAFVIYRFWSAFTGRGFISDDDSSDSESSSSLSTLAGLTPEDPHEPIPDFKYHPYPLDTNSATQYATITCDICNREAFVYYDMFPFYTAEAPDGESDIEVDVCLDCIKSGGVTRKYTGKFNNPDFSEQPVFDVAKRDEFALRTPGLFMEHPLWLTHCNDYCAAITYVYNWLDLEIEGLDEEVENDWVLYKDATISTIEEIKEVMHHEYEGDTKYLGILFRCIHCDKHRLYIETMEDDDDEDEEEYDLDDDNDSDDE